MLQCVAACCNALQRDAVCVAMKTRLPRTPLSACLRFDMMQRVAACCSVLQCVAACCSVQGDED